MLEAVPPLSDGEQHHRVKFGVLRLGLSYTNPLMIQGGSISYDLRQATVTVWNNTLCGTRYGTGTNGINTLKLCAAAPGRDTCQV